MTRRERAMRSARRGTVITGLALLGLVGVYVRALAFTPVERLQGLAQKIFYVHAPAAWAALLAWAMNAAWSSLSNATELPSWLGWLTPDSSSVGIEMLITLVAFGIREGGTVGEDS